MGAIGGIDLRGRLCHLVQPTGCLIKADLASTTLDFTLLEATRLQAEVQMSSCLAQQAVRPEGMIPKDLIPLRRISANAR